MFFHCFIFFSFFFLAASSSSCPGSNTWKTNCYVFGTEKLEFLKADTTCIRKGGHLASIHDFYEDDVIGQAAEFAYHSRTDFWIGAYRSGSGAWKWTDGSNFNNFTYWATGEPSNLAGNGCAIMSYYDWNWKTEGCTSVKSYVCAIPIPNLKPSRLNRLMHLIK
uniref:C-type lectin domain-containing protein n=1 Tax=Panagrolaimus sp. ES5 TaxID=591445 RepID=A0AC34G4W0_9BILA